MLIIYQHNAMGMQNVEECHITLEHRDISEKKKISYCKWTRTHCRHDQSNWCERNYPASTAVRRYERRSSPFEPKKLICQYNII